MKCRFLELNIFTTRRFFQTLYGVPWSKSLVSSVYSVGIAKQKYQVAEKVRAVSRFMSIDKNDRYTCSRYSDITPLELRHLKLY